MLEYKPPRLFSRVFNNLFIFNNQPLKVDVISRPLARSIVPTKKIMNFSHLFNFLEIARHLIVKQARLLVVG